MLLYLIVRNFSQKFEMRRIFRQFKCFNIHFMPIFGMMSQNLSNLKIFQKFMTIQINFYELISTKFPFRNRIKNFRRT